MNHRRDARAVGCDPDGTRSQWVVGGAACACDERCHSAISSSSRRATKSCWIFGTRLGSRRVRRLHARAPSSPRTSRGARRHVVSARVTDPPIDRGRVSWGSAGPNPRATPRDRPEPPSPVLVESAPARRVPRSRRRVHLRANRSVRRVRPPRRSRSRRRCARRRVPRPLEHTMVLVRHPGDPVATAYDFLPSDPTNPATAASLLRGGSVPGECRVRPLRGIPSRRCWRVGYAAIETTNAIDDAAASFQTAYDAKVTSRRKQLQRTHSRVGRGARRGDPSASKRFSRADGRWRSERGESDTNDIDGGVLVVDTSYYTR